MAKAKKNPVPLATLLARRECSIAQNEHLVQRIEPLPSPVTFYFWFPRQPVPKSGTFTLRTKAGHNVQIADKGQVEAERATRELVMDALRDYYPEWIPYLPLVNGSVQVYSIHLMAPGEGWYPEQDHVSTPDVDNLGKLVKDAPAARTKGTYAVLYWDDCPVNDDWQRKEYWNPTLPEPYPQQPGTVMLVRLAPPKVPFGKYACPYCNKHYRKSISVEKHIPLCPLYNGVAIT